MIYIAFSAYMVYLSPGHPRNEILLDTMFFMLKTIVPARISARVISWYANFNEGECFLLSNSFISIMEEMVQRFNSPQPWSFPVPFISVTVVTAIIKFIVAKMRSKSPMSTLISFALGNIIGRFIDAEIGYCVGRGGSYLKGIIQYLNQLSAWILIISAISGQLLPDVLAFLIRLPLLKMKKTSMLHSFCDRLTRFAWLFESPKSLEKLLEIIESKDLLPDGATERNIEHGYGL